MGLDDEPHPLGHGLAELLEVVLLHGGDPQLLDLLRQLRHRGDVFLLQLVLHVVPGIFNRVQVRTIAWPVHDLKRLVLQEVHDLLRLMAGGPILKEVGAAVNLHEGDEVVLQHL